MVNEAISSISSTRPSFNNFNVSTNYFNSIQAKGNYQHIGLPADFGVNELHTICDLGLKSFSDGETVGLNPFNDLYGGGLNTNPLSSFKERELVAKTGEFSQSTFALVA